VCVSIPARWNGPWPGPPGPKVEATGEHVGDGVDVQRYEALRRHALGGDTAGWRLGLALLEHRGVAAWLRAWQPTAAAPRRPGPSPEAHMPGGDALVAVLASMATGLFPSPVRA
jgi:hypothetical protein